MHPSEDFTLNNDGTEPLFVQSWSEHKRRVIKPVLEWQDPERVPCRVGFVGCNASKARVAQWVADEIDLPLIHGVSKTIDRVNEEPSLIERYNAIYLAQLYEEMKCGEFVADNTTMDILANIWYDIERKKLAAGMLTNILATSSQYTIVFYLPPGSTRKAKSLDKSIRRILDNFMIDYVPLIGDDIIKTKIAVHYLEAIGMADSGDEEDDE